MKIIPRDYWGSVLFFKHIFLSILLLVIIIPITLATVQAYKINTLENKIIELNANLVKQALGSDTTTTTTDTTTDTTDDKTDNTEIMYGSATASSQPQFTQRVEAPAYQYKYPDFTSNATLATPVNLQRKVLYLTFDDGPSARTTEILDILAIYDFKATFFVVGTQLTSETNQAILKRIADEGHTIGLHSNSHNYEDIYSSVDAFLDDMYELTTKIQDITGVTPQIFRFAGGSINNHNRQIYQEIIAEMLRRGFLYYDWNASAHDAVFGDITSAYVFNQATQHGNYDRIFLLMHDDTNKHSTVSALPLILDYYINQGYTIEPITETVAPVAFVYN